MMLTPLDREAAGFLLFVLAGMATGVLYHIARVILPEFAEKQTAVWTLTAAGGFFAVYAAAYFYNYAAPRFFFLFGAALGFFIYIMTVGRVFFSVFSLFWKKILKICGFIFKILLTPVRFLHKIIMIPLYTAAVGLKGLLKRKAKKCFGRFADEEAGKKEGGFADKKRIFRKQDGTGHNMRGSVGADDRAGHRSAAADKRKPRDGGGA